MNDRELLEAAAKAAGLNVSWGEKTTMGSDVYDFTDLLFVEGAEHCAVWSPLDDDGDALRLAVKLHIDIQFFEGFQEVIAEHASGQYAQSSEDFCEDMNFTTRRAIVRAAAEIGRAMP